MRVSHRQLIIPKTPCLNEAECFFMQEEKGIFKIKRGIKRERGIVGRELVADITMSFLVTV